MQPSCHDEERNALIQFNKSFKLDCRSRQDPFLTVVVHPKTSSWGSNNGTNCCSWDGVDCDVETGHVIGLYLNSSCLYGSFHSNNTIFHLVHLQELDLSYNNFTFSPIPTAMGFFPELKFLRLRSSFFQEFIWLGDFLNQRSLQIHYKDLRECWAWTISFPINTLPRPLEISPLPFGNL
ncbi:receptor-like protein 6 isoform X1 [Humulus lupulus]|uniref:receptor-like protein 6 isoform X1 n=1 Tax=Humulus lupulus TaxID=3486 RepID=UPI002B41754D|nr:receptor-like protein 6 isoform X1 [Humulus lupulus]